MVYGSTRLQVQERSPSWEKSYKFSIKNKNNLCLREILQISDKIFKIRSHVVVNTHLYRYTVVLDIFDDLVSPYLYYIA